MKHITKEYGMEANYLVLTSEEYKVLDKFLEKLGVRSRVTMFWQENDEFIVKIQAENVYRSCFGSKREFADSFMTADSLAAYKR